MEQFRAAHARTPSVMFSRVSLQFYPDGDSYIRYICVSNTWLNSFAPGSVGLVSRFGKFYRAVDPGLVQINVCTESLRVVDVKIQISPIGRQKVITRDNVDVEM